ncbi:MotA/TolQ/ExbB proton channel family protein [Candidatus Babeliales bacterium]|nr:MotA/TolQ/ExbB proton channel family protein [Candidatus Babeliales bacterium]
MFNFIFNSAAWQLIVQADWMTKLILLSLFSLSVVCIAIIVFKFLTLRNEKRKMSKLIDNIKISSSFSDLIQIGKKFEDSLGGKFLIQNLNELKFILERKENNNHKLKIQDIEYLEILSDQSIDRLLMQAEVYLPVLGTSASVAPFVGLFGTIWGLIHSFVIISQEKSANISASVIAPGIAEALTTTLAGLIVAIPAMIAFHCFSNELRKIEQQMGHLSDRFLRIIKQSFIK